MPIIVTPNQNTFDENVDVAVGIGFPLSITGTMSGSGQFNQTYSINEQAFHNLRQCLLTIQGELPNNPTFGSNLYRMIFDPNTKELKTAISNEIERAIGTWCSWVSIRDIVVTSEDGSNIIEVSVKFTVNATAFEAELNLTYNGNTGTATATPGTTATTAGGY